jgi:hypothetical protein
MPKAAIVAGVRGEIYKQSIDNQTHLRNYNAELPESPENATIPQVLPGIAWRVLRDGDAQERRKGKRCKRFAETS